MITNSFYLSDAANISLCLELTELSLDELEELVGYFGKQSHRHGDMRGEVVEYVNGGVAIRHHFTKKLIWRKE